MDNWQLDWPTKRKYIEITQKIGQIFVFGSLLKYLEIIAMESVEERISAFQKHLGLVDEPVFAEKFVQKIKNNISNARFTDAQTTGHRDIMVPMLIEIAQTFDRLVLFGLLYLHQHSTNVDVEELEQQARDVVCENETYREPSDCFNYDLGELAMCIEEKIINNRQVGQTDLSINY